MSQISKVIHAINTLPLSSKHRVSQISFHPSQAILAVQSHDRSVEIFRIRSEEEVRKKQQRRKKRAKEKKEKKSGEKQTQEGVKDEDPENEEITLVDLFTPHVVVRANGKIRSFDFGVDGTGPKDSIQVC
jgi:U3 small nucleolar RNA-associated protein 12